MQLRVSVGLEMQLIYYGFIIAPPMWWDVNHQEDVNHQGGKMLPGILVPRYGGIVNPSPSPPSLSPDGRLLPPPIFFFFSRYRAGLGTMHSGNVLKYVDASLCRGDITVSRLQVRVFFFCYNIERCSSVCVCVLRACACLCVPVRACAFVFY